MTGAPIHGRLSRLPDGKLEGWCYCATDLSARRIVALTLDDLPLISVVAAKFRADLFERRVGDGYYGFTVSAPDLGFERGIPRLLEARDQATGVLFGRIVMEEGDGEQRLRERLEGIASSIASLQQLDSTHRPAANTFRQGLEAVGLGLRARLTPAQFGGPLLAGARSRPLTPRRYPWSAAPRVTLALCQPTSLTDALAQIDDLRSVAMGSPSELIVVDDGADAALSYLPSVVEGVALLREPGSSISDAVNAAAWAARGEVLVFLNGCRCPEPAWLLNAIRQATDGVQIVYSDATRPPSGVTQSATPPSVAVCVRRDQFESLGGLEVMGPGADNPWDEFIQKCRLLGHPVDVAVA